MRFRTPAGSRGKPREAEGSRGKQREADESRGRSEGNHTQKWHCPVAKTIGFIGVFQILASTFCLEALSGSQRRAFLDNRADQLTGTIFSKCVFAHTRGAEGSREKQREAEGRRGKQRKADEAAKPKPRRRQTKATQGCFLHWVSGFGPWVFGARALRRNVCAKRAAHYCGPAPRTIAGSAAQRTKRFAGTSVPTV